MSPEVRAADLLRRHVLWDGEEIEHVREWPDGLAVTTTFRHFAGGPEAGAWAVGREPWVRDVLVLTRDDLVVEGEPERFGFLLPVDGPAVCLNDPAAVAELGRRLADGLDPVAYAEILVRFHPYSSAVRGLQTAPEVMRTAHGLTVGFRSFARHRPPGGAPVQDLTDWTVEVPAGGPACWETRPAS